MRLCFEQLCSNILHKHIAQFLCNWKKAERLEKHWKRKYRSCTGIGCELYGIDLLVTNFLTHSPGSRYLYEMSWKEFALHRWAVCFKRGCDTLCETMQNTHYRFLTLLGSRLHRCKKKKLYRWFFVISFFLLNERTAFWN